MRRNFFILGFLGLAFAFILTYSCNDSIGINTEESLNQRESKLNCLYYSNIPVDSLNFDFIGKQHNDFLLKVMENMEKEDEWSLDGVINSFEKFGILITNKDALPQSYQMYLDSTYSFIINNFNSVESKVYYDNIFSLLDNSESLNEYKFNLSKNLEKAREVIQCEADFMIIEGTSKLMEYSTLFWAPRTWGGQGNFDRFVENRVNTRAPRWSWRKMAIGDGLGVGSGLIGSAVVIGLTVASGPVGWGILGGTIASAAFGSAFGGAGVP